MKYAAAITLYNPTSEQIAHCKEYAESFQRVFILDNSEEENILIQRSFEASCFTYIKMNGNEGLPNAFNRVLDLKQLNTFDYLCTLDQDSIFSFHDISRMKAFIEQSNKNKEFSKVAIYAPVIDYGNGIKYTNGYEYRNKVITSGSFLKVKELKKHNIRYDENYFIDKFEIDLCQQLLTYGYQIVVCFESVLKQQLGDSNNTKHSSHNSLRHYYLFRNRLYFNHKYYGKAKRYSLNTLQTVRHVVSILLYEKEPVEKIAQLFPAIKDYCLGRMGKRG